MAVCSWDDRNLDGRDASSMRILDATWIANFFEKPFWGSPCMLMKARKTLPSRWSRTLTWHGDLRPEGLIGGRMAQDLAEASWAWGVPELHRGGSEVDDSESPWKLGELLATVQMLRSEELSGAPRRAVANGPAWRHHGGAACLRGPGKSGRGCSWPQWRRLVRSWKVLWESWHCGLVMVAGAWCECAVPGRRHWPMPEHPDGPQLWVVSRPTGFDVKSPGAGWDMAWKRWREDWSRRMGQNQPVAGRHLYGTRGEEGLSLDGGRYPTHYPCGRWSRANWAGGSGRTWAQELCAESWTPSHPGRWTDQPEDLCQSPCWQWWGME